MDDDDRSPSAPPPPPPPPQTTHPELSYTTIPLNTPATEIRLLELFPSAEFSSPLHCRLYNTPISSPAPFKALSYAWGSDDKTHLIYINSNDTSDSDNGNDADADANLARGLSAVNVSSGDNEVGGRGRYRRRRRWGRAGAMNGEGRTDLDPNPDARMPGTTPTPTKRCIIRITSSLDTGLRHLRAIHHRDHQDNGQSLTLWIGQLCIDQSNQDEKAVQVGLMSQIYLRAKQVLIWLGPEADRSDKVMNAWAELGTEFESVGMKLGDCGSIEEVMMGFLNGGDGDGVGSDLGVGVGVADTEALDGVAVACTTNKADTSTERTIMAVIEDGAAKLARLWKAGELQALFRRPWFTRVWVVQEACHCEDTVFVCGTKPPVSYDILGAIMLCMVYAMREFQGKGGCGPEWDVVSPIGTGVEIAGVRMSRDVAWALGGLVQPICAFYVSRHCSLKQISEGEGGDDLFTLLVSMYANLHSFREAKLHRDRVYALLGMAGDVDELEIKPDYSRQTGTARILTEVAKAIIGKTKDGFRVELLSYSQFPKTILDNGSDEQLPSWVPDWRSGLRTPFYYEIDRVLFMACGPHTSVDMVPTTTAGMLGLRGYLVDTIEEVGGMASQESSTKPPLQESIEFFEKLDRLWELSKQKNEPIYETQARRAEAPWRVPIGDMLLDGEHMSQDRVKPDFALEYHKWRRTLELYQAIDCVMVDEDKKKKATE